MALKIALAGNPMPRYPFESAQFHANRSALQGVRIDHHEVSENGENPQKHRNDIL